MAFASLEEAWGMAVLGARDADRPMSSPARPDAGQDSSPGSPRRIPFSKLVKPKAAGARAFAPAEDDNDALGATRQFLAETYDRFGMPGVMRLLPREAASKLKDGDRQDRRGKRGKRGRRGCFWSRMKRLLSRPEALLCGLFIAFVLLVLWDRRAEPPMPTLTSLHMSPFPLGTS